MNRSGGSSHEAQELFCSALNIDLPIIGGAMYPCSNPELVAAVSEAGGVGIVQPLSLTAHNALYPFQHPSNHLLTANSGHL